MTDVIWKMENLSVSCSPLSRMQRLTLNITNRLGLHARAAAKLVKLANSFRCDVRLARMESIVNQQPLDPELAELETAGPEPAPVCGHAPPGQVDAKSIFGILLLAASKGAVVEVVTEGADEIEAMEAVRKLIEDKFGED
jgi:phosphocarrier protein HPr